MITQQNKIDALTKVWLAIALVCILQPSFADTDTADLSEDFLKERLLERLHVPVNLVPPADKSLSPTFNPDQFLFGEEFEYWIEPIDGVYQYEYPHAILKAWKKKLEQKLQHLNIPKDAYSLEIRKGIYFPARSDNGGLTHSEMKGVISNLLSQDEIEQLEAIDAAEDDEDEDEPKTPNHRQPNDMFVETLFIQIGNWSSRVFIDSWTTHLKTENLEYDLLEVHASPYRLNQSFQVNNKDYSVYDLITLFITDIASDISGLKYASGHKHLDLKNSVGSNVELLFRMLVDIENKAWISQLFGCSQDSGTGESFVYISQADQITQDNFRKTIERFNQLISQGYSAQPNDLFYSYTRFALMWTELFHKDHKPANMKFGHLKSRLMDDSVERGEIIARPKGTLELRFLPTAQTGQEARLINQMLVNWFQVQYNDQQQSRQIRYKPNDPQKPVSRQFLKQRFYRFLQALELPLMEYEVFSREGCEPPPYVVPTPLSPEQIQNADDENGDDPQ
ncbi:hypothetical protein [Endozoicomonas sp. OPT23]|uniref:hypothetical protein n=1 Tax=Endozoicomonas sp. OPT23 TaxID=2072845 RepID=UPI001890C897|nr:hypothetical protein [Endozoicomonas sp. OPT23]